MDEGAPISYLVLAEDTPVYGSDGGEVGTVKRVLAAEEEDIFDGLVVDTPDGDRFVDGDGVGRMFERAVHLEMTAEQVRRLPEPGANPAVMEADPDDSADSELVRRARAVWDRISGNY